MANDVNFSPEMIDNLVNMLKNSGFTDNMSNSNSSNQGFNNQNHNENIHNQKKSENVSNSRNDNSSNPFENIDIATIMKIKSVMDSFNDKNDPDTKLLYSLKPYLRKSKQEKLDQYMSILKVSQLSKMFKNEKGDT